MLEINGVLGLFFGSFRGCADLGSSSVTRVIIYWYSRQFRWSCTLFYTPLVGIKQDISAYPKEGRGKEVKAEEKKKAWLEDDDRRITGRGRDTAQ